MRICKSNLMLTSRLLLLLTVFLMLPNSFSYGQDRPVDRVNLTKHIESEIGIVDISSTNELYGNATDGAILIDFVDRINAPSAYSIIYQLHIPGNYQLVSGITAQNGQLKIENAPNGEYFGFQIVRELDGAASVPNDAQINLAPASLARETENSTNARATCSKTYNDCVGTSRSFTNLESGNFYNSSATFRPCGFYLNDNCEVTDVSRWHCIDGNLSAPSAHTGYSYAAIGYSEMGLTAIQASRLNWIICNYAYNASGVLAAVWYISGTGGSSNNIVLAANAAITSPDGSEDLMSFYKANVSGVQDMVKWECQTACSLSVDAGADDIICDDESTTLTATTNGGTAPYTYIWNNGLGAGATQTVAPNSTTLYSVTVTDANGCTSTDEVLVTVEPSFVSGIDGPDTRCAGEGLLFTATPVVAGAIYSWTFSGPASPASSTDPSVVVTWASEGTYTVTLTVTRGVCEETYTKQVVITEEVFAAAGPDKEICQGASVEIGGNPTGPVGADYLWTPNLFLDDNSVSNPTSTPPVTITYTVQVTQNGCTRTESVTVNVNVDLNPMPEAGSAQTTCDNEPVTLGDPNTIPSVSYQWSTSAGDIPGATTSTLLVNPSIDTWYFVTAVNNQGCEGRDSVLVNVFPAPTVNAGADDQICDGESTTLSATATGGTAPYSFTWSNGLGNGATQTVSTSSTTTYTVTVTDANGCMDTDDVTITVYPSPTVDAGANQSTCGVEQVTLTASGSGGTSPYIYEWNNGLGNGPVQTASPEVTTVYTVLLTDANGCTSTDEVRITVNEIPVVDLGADMTTCEGDEVTIYCSSKWWIDAL